MIDEVVVYLIVHLLATFRGISVQTSRVVSHIPHRYLWMNLQIFIIGACIFRWFFRLKYWYSISLWNFNSVVKSMEDFGRFSWRVKLGVVIAFFPLPLLIIIRFHLWVHHFENGIIRFVPDFFLDDKRIQNSPPLHVFIDLYKIIGLIGVKIQRLILPWQFVFDNSSGNLSCHALHYFLQIDGS